MKLSELKSEELMLMIENQPPEVQFIESAIAARFISAMQLRPGKKPMPFRIIWKLFKFYSNEKLKKSDLGKSLRLRFRRKRNKYDVCYFINKDFKYFSK